RRAVTLLADPDSTERVVPPLDELREAAEGLAASDEELLLLALFAEEAEPLLRSIRGRRSRDESSSAGVDEQRSERIRELVRIVQESGIGEVTIEEDGMRVTVRRTEEPDALTMGEASLALDEPPVPSPPRPNGLIRVESPMVGVFYRSPQP